jgi:septal ring factor EnvC (AmiA/AmiB activator)
VITHVLLAAATVLAFSVAALLFLWRVERQNARQMRSRIEELHRQLAGAQRRLRQAETQRLQAQRRARQEHVVAEQLAIRQSAMETRSLRQILATLDSKLAAEEKRLAGRDGVGFKVCHDKRNAVQTMMHTLIANRLDRDLAEAERALVSSDPGSSGDSRHELIRARATELLRNAKTPAHS